MSNKNFPTYPGWKVVREIGRGSFGGVYEIERKIGGTIEKAALKHIAIPQNDGEIRSMRQMGMDDASVTNMFEEQKESVLKEYLLMRNLGGHTNVVNCDDVSEIQHSDGMGWDIYIRMELLTALTEKIKSYPGEEETIRLGVDLCSALVLCEKNKIIHRDIKPQNIFVSPNGDYKLGDFGIARTIESATHGASTIGIGTNNYMAPEVRYGNEKYNHTVDIYSLGLVMYWLLNEMRLPFCPLPPIPLKLSDMQNAQARRIKGESLPAPKHGSDRLKAIVLKACAFDPKERYQSAAEMKQALETLGKIEEKLDETVPMIDLLTENDATMGAWTPVVKTLPVEESVPVIEPVIADKPVMKVDNIEIPTENEDKTVGMWAAIEAERERKRKEAEESERQRIEAEQKRLAEEAAEKERQRLLEEQRIRDEKAAELKRQKELEEKKKREAEEAERIRKLAEEKKKQQEKTKKKLLLLLVLLLMVAIGANTLLFKNGKTTPTPPSAFNYEVLEDGTVKITGLKDNDLRNVVIPPSIDGRVVTSIRAHAFSLSAMKTLTIPDSVTRIENYAFSGCPKLKNIYYEGHQSNGHIVRNGLSYDGAVNIHFNYKGYDIHKIS